MKLKTTPKVKISSLNNHPLNRSILVHKKIICQCRINFTKSNYKDILVFFFKYLISKDKKYLKTVQRRI